MRLGIGVAAALVAVPAVATPAHYDLRVALDQARGRLAVVARLSGLPCAGDRLRIHLNRGLTISEARVDGRRVVPQLDPQGAPQFWLSAARSIDLPCPARDVELRYGGPGTLSKDGRNQVSAELVELSLYGAWYPIATLDQKFTWRLRTGVPPGTAFATNGVVSATRPGRIDARRETPGDIVLIAAPRFRKTSVSASGVTVHLLASDDLTPTAAARAAALAGEAAAAAAEMARDLDTRQAELTLVFTRRGGPLSYARLPLIVTPQAVLADPPGARPVEFNIRHEVGHLWSRANGAADDWINEGFAEYAALVRTGTIEGAAGRAAVVARYRREVAAAGIGPSILETGTSDDFSYINRYARMMLLLDAIERRAGAPAMTAFRRAAFRDQTTDGVDAAARATLGPAAAQLLAVCLRSRDWPPECGGSTKG